MGHILAKLMSLPAATKGATVIVLGAATVTVGAAPPEVQHTMHNVIEAGSGQTPDADTNDCDTGQPEVVALRNAATTLIDAAFPAGSQAQGAARHGCRNKAAGDLIKTADEKLKGLRTKALNDVAALTLGREGQNKTDDSPRLQPRPRRPRAWHRPRPRPRARRRPMPASRIRKAA